MRNIFIIHFFVLIKDAMTGEMKIFFVNMFNRLCRDQSVYSRRVSHVIKYSS